MEPLKEQNGGQLAECDARARVERSTSVHESMLRAVLSEPPTAPGPCGHRGRG